MMTGMTIPSFTKVLIRCSKDILVRPNSFTFGDDYRPFIIAGGGSSDLEGEANADADVLILTPRSLSFRNR